MSETKDAVPLPLGTSSGASALATFLTPPPPPPPSRFLEREVAPHVTQVLQLHRLVKPNAPVASVQHLAHHSSILPSSRRRTFAIVRRSRPSEKETRNAESDWGPPRWGQQPARHNALGQGANIRGLKIWFYEFTRVERTLSLQEFLLNGLRSRASNPSPPASWRRAGGCAVSPGRA